MSKLVHQLTGAPIYEPIGIEDVREQLGIVTRDDSDRNPAILAEITAARMWAEEYMGRAIITQTRRAYGSGFSDEMPLIAELQSVNSINYINTNGVDTVLDVASYYVDTVRHRVMPAYGLDWPDTREQANAVTIEYVCGYGEPSEVPQAIKHALLIIVDYWETHKSQIESGLTIRTIPYAAEQLIRPYIDYRGIF